MEGHPFCVKCPLSYVKKKKIIPTKTLYGVIENKCIRFEEFKFFTFFTIGNWSGAPLSDLITNEAAEGFLYWIIK